MGWLLLVRALSMPSRKRLRSVAHSVAHHFASTLNYWKDDYAIHHLWHASVATGQPEITIDILACTTTPESMNQGRVAEILPPLREFLIELLQKEKFSPNEVSGATMRYHFRGRKLLFDLPAYSCHVSLSTPDGQKYVANLDEDEG